MTIFTYARVSTLDQDTGYQEEALKAAYPDAVHRQEKKSGTSTKGRDILELLLDMMGKDDKLVVWKLDRLARNVGDLCRIVERLTEKGAALEILDQRIDTSTATGRAFLQMLGVFAEFETNLRKERQLAGIKQAKAKGIHMGRPKLLTDKQKAEIRQLYTKGTTPKVLAEQFKVSRATIYNVTAPTKGRAAS
ncbi:recombinase family protein [Desulfobacter postgatei]|uniref:Site-specific recombinase, DNA invertase Pin n=1 Tax=Desulfobacter postgatei 2ac9 TaxID=879212 RepID=I5B7M2_9BACT|nr:recombinase family protein [Desulfobacter postgatei]EIM65485.1 site-specific recombinase, DNA invertase Pin [Desulfobacter postgatei 2ac9]